MTARLARRRSLLIALAFVAHPRADAVAEPTAARECADAVRTPAVRVIADACGRAAADSPAPAFLLWAGAARVELVSTDPSPDFTEARDFLQRAVAAEPRLWRAHYYLGRIHRANGDDAAAAESFTRGIYANPRSGPSYVALAVIYERWGYLDLALQVASIGSEHVTDRSDRSKLWYMVATSRYDLGQRDRALADIDRAVLDDPGNQRARFLRGQWLAVAGKYAEARPDLEAVVKDPPDPLLGDVARRWLDRIAAETDPAAQPRDRR